MPHPGAEIRVTMQRTHGTMLWDASPRRIAWLDQAEGSTCVSTRLPRGFSSRSSSSCSSPASSRAEGKCVLKNVWAEARSARWARSEKGMKRVRVNEPSCGVLG
jgi:hypothetical protein